MKHMSQVTRINIFQLARIMIILSLVYGDILTYMYRGFKIHTHADSLGKLNSNVLACSKSRFNSSFQDIWDNRGTKCHSSYN